MRRGTTGLWPPLLSARPRPRLSIAAQVPANGLHTFSLCGHILSYLNLHEDQEGLCTTTASSATISPESIWRAATAPAPANCRIPVKKRRCRIANKPANPFHVTRSCLCPAWTAPDSKACRNSTCNIPANWRPCRSCVCVCVLMLS